MAEDEFPQQSGPRAREAGRETVVAGLDGSAHEDAVVTWAAAAAQRHGARLDLVHVVEVGVTLTPYDMLAGEVPWYGEELAAAARAHLEEVASTVRGRHPDLEVRLLSPVGSPAAVLVGLSEGATVVVGASGHSRIERLVLGSTALAVVAHGHGTVVVVPRSAAAGGAAPGGRRRGRQRRRRPGRSRTPWPRRRRPGGQVTVVTAWTVEVEDGVVVTEPGTERWRRVEERLVDAVAPGIGGGARRAPRRAGRRPSSATGHPGDGPARRGRGGRRGPRGGRAPGTWRVRRPAHGQREPHRRPTLTGAGGRRPLTAPGSAQGGPHERGEAVAVARPGGVVDVEHRRSSSPRGRAWWRRRRAR